MPRGEECGLKALVTLKMVRIKWILEWLIHNVTSKMSRCPACTNRHCKRRISTAPLSIADSPTHSAYKYLPHPPFFFSPSNTKCLPCLSNELHRHAWHAFSFPQNQTFRSYVFFPASPPLVPKCGWWTSMCGVCDFPKTETRVAMCSFLACLFVSEKGYAESVI